MAGHILSSPIWQPQIWDLSSGDSGPIGKIERQRNEILRPVEFGRNDGPRSLRAHRIHRLRDQTQPRPARGNVRLSPEVGPVQLLDTSSPGRAYYLTRASGSNFPCFHDGAFTSIYLGGHRSDDAAAPGGGTAAVACRIFLCAVSESSLLPHPMHLSVAER